MPFTPTHIAAAVPIAWLCRWRLPFSALAIGTMVADVPVFYPALMDYGVTHSMTGVLTHCVPLGVFLYYLYQTILKRPLTDLLPRPVAARLQPWIDKPIDFSPLAVFVVFLCVALGSATHVFWDSFTHAGRWGVEMFPAINAVAVDTATYSVRWYTILQHGSTMLLLPPMLLGFLFWVWKQPGNSQPMNHAQMPRSIAWTVIALMMVATVLYCHVMHQYHPTRSWGATLRFSIRDCGGVSLGIVLAYCFGMQYVWWRDRSEDLRGWLHQGEQSS